MSSKSKSGKGFTLVELMIALLVFMVAVLGLAPLLVTNIHTGARTDLRNQAQVMAAERMDALQAMDDYTGLPGMAAEENFPPLTRTTDIATDTPGSGQTTVTVTVNWSYRGEALSYQLQTIKTETETVSP